MNRIKEVTKSKVEDPKSYVNFLNKKKKFYRFTRPIALIASLAAAFLSTGCATNQDKPTNTPLSTMEEPTLLPPTPTMEATPEVTPTPTETPTPMPTPAYVQTCVLESPEDALDDDKVTIILEELRAHYLNTSFASGELTANDDIVENWIKWQAVPNGVINDESIEEFYFQWNAIKKTEEEQLLRARDKGETLNNPILLSIEALFLKESETQKVYRELFEIETSFYKMVGTDEENENVERIAYYVCNNFVLEDTIFNRVVNGTAFDKYKILKQIRWLVSLTMDYIPYFEPIIDGKKIEAMEYLNMYMAKDTEYNNRFKEEMIVSSKAIKNSLSH